MFSLALIAGLLCVVAWLYLLFGHGNFWRISSARVVPNDLPQRPSGASRLVAAVIPARDEADAIGRAVASLLRQAGHELHIFVVDDNSTDGTADAARMAGVADEVRGAESGRVTVISGQPLRPGWSGKLWAVQQGVERALLLKPDYLLLTDADIEHAPDNVARLVSVAEAGGYDLASFMVKLHCRSVAEKLLIPAFVFFFFMLYPPEWVRKSPTLSPKGRTRTLRQAQGGLRGASTAGAAGGCMLVRPAALERIGGIAAIRQAIIDDCALADAVKRFGGRVWLGVEDKDLRSPPPHSLTPGGPQPATRNTHSLRPYNSFAEIERMIARTAFSQLHHSAWLLLGTTIGMLLLYVLPIVLMASGSPWLGIIGAFAFGLMSAAYLPIVRSYGRNRLWALTLPFAGMFYTVATVDSAVRYWRGRGGEWKGRVQDRTPQEH